LYKYTFKALLHSNCKVIVIRIISKIWWQDWF